METRLKIFKVSQALAFLLIPLVLIFVQGGVLKSISEYANYSPMTFALSLSLAAAIFIYDGVSYETRWYNIYVGMALIGVVLFINHLFPIIHYTFAGIFFLGSLFNMVYFSSNKQRFIKSIVAFGVLFGMAGHYFFGWYSLFWAEWIGMVPISIHYILEITGKID